MRPHDLPILIKSKLLSPLGDPTPNAPKYFAAVDVESRARDGSWLNRATKILAKNWQLKNKKKTGGRRESGAESEAVMDTYPATQAD
jgi:uncharacterized protein (DUF2344 family)